MTTLATDIAAPVAGPAAATASKPRYFFGPVVDFLLLGGSSLLLLPLAILLPDSSKTGVGVVMTALALLINHPHFAHSYQLFYRDFQAKGFGQVLNQGLRKRYLLAGIVVPVLLGCFMAGTLTAGDVSVLGAAGNAMAFFVGWHYVKQGYGMLIVDGVLKRQFFTPTERNVLLANAYAVWALTWISLNVGGSGGKLFGIDYYVLNVPDVLQTVASVVTAATSVGVLAVFARKWHTKPAAMPVSGVAAYLVTLYLWMTFVRIDPIWLLIVPALHSMQYLIVVYRYESNRQLARDDAYEPAAPGVGKLGRVKYRRRLLSFAGGGIGLGLLGFWLVPLALEVVVPSASFGAGAAVFLFSFWVFINVHHYFIDNVIWRSENPDVKRFLFEAPAPRAKGLAAESFAKAA